MSCRSCTVAIIHRAWERRDARRESATSTSILDEGPDICIVVIVTHGKERVMLRKSTLEKIIGAIGGAGAGIVVGSIAGGVGAIIGAVIGAIGGFTIAFAVDKEENRVSFNDRELDRQIGVEGGDMGSPKHPVPPVLTFDENAWYV